MVKVKLEGGIVGYDANHSVVVKLFADKKAEVKDNDEGMNVVGLPAGYSIAAESTVRTANFEVASMDSEGKWHWAGEEE